MDISYTVEGTSGPGQRKINLLRTADKIMFGWVNYRGFDPLKDKKYGWVFYGAEDAECRCARGIYVSQIPEHNGTWMSIGNYDLAKGEES
jgi:hypothetical protein